MSKQVVEYSAQRIIYESSRLTSDVLASLDVELSRDKAGQAVFNLLATATTKEQIIEGMNAIIGDNDFAFFFANNYSGWLGVYLGLTIPNTNIYALGNPIIAQTMLQFDITGSLSVPPEILVIEKEGNSGTKIVYDLPSSRIAINGNAELLQAAEVLDAKLEALVQKVLQV